MNEPSSENYNLPVVDVLQLRRQGQAQKWAIEDKTAAAPSTYRVRLGHEPISVNTIEFRILSFLAANPYHAYSRRRIAEAVTSDRDPVDEETLDGHIASLRAKLGFFADYIQSVPYIGYRFKE